MEEKIAKVYEFLELAQQKFNDRTKVPLAESLIREEVDEMLFGSASEDINEMIDGFVDTFWVGLNLLYFYGVGGELILKKFEQVELSNFSKYCKTLEEAQASVEAYLNAKHPNKPNEVIRARIGETNSKEFPYCILRDDDKILKSILYRSPEEF